VETAVSIRGLVKKYAEHDKEPEIPYKVREIKIDEFPVIIRRGVLLATAKTKDGQEVLLCLPDAAKFYEVAELWDGSFYSDLELWFVPNNKRAALACAFTKLYGFPEDVQKNPLRFKGLGWGGNTYWVAIANDLPVAQQGELFPAARQEPIPLNIVDKDVFIGVKNLLSQKKIFSLTFYKINKNQGDLFRLIYPWWIQKSLFQELTKTPAAERLENVS